MATHLAAVTLGKGERFTVQSRSTPKPGTGELLIQVKSVALNPADHLMRDEGLRVSSYPAILGFDISGLVLDIGENVSDATDSKGIALKFKPGITRVAAYVAMVWRDCNPDYGAFQEKCIVPWQHAVPLPDKNISWNQAASLPVAVQVPLSAWDAMGIPRPRDVTTTSDSANATSETHDQRMHKKHILLVWGASSSVGTMGVQSARLMCENPYSSFAAVYATAGKNNLEYVKSLGAHRVFDHQDFYVTKTIVAAAREDGLLIRHCFLATGRLVLCQAVLQHFVAETPGSRAMFISAPLLPADMNQEEGVDVIFVMPSMDNEEERLEQFRYWVGTWLKRGLAEGTISPSPEVRVVGRGLDSIDASLDELVLGVSCQKLVVEIA